MKKFFAILLALTMVFALFACSNTTDDGQANTENNEQAEEETTASAESDVSTDFDLESVTAFAEDVETDGMKFYWVGKVLGGTYWTGVETGMTAAGDELGIEITM